MCVGRRKFIPIIRDGLYKRKEKPSATKVSVNNKKCVWGKNWKVCYRDVASRLQHIETKKK